MDAQLSTCPPTKRTTKESAQNHNLSVSLHPAATAAHGAYSSCSLMHVDFFNIGLNTSLWLANSNFNSRRLPDSL
jgi:hypothetical protein